MREADVLRAFSFGGGVQSTAALVLAARGEIDYPLFIFANVGADSENPLTLAYVENIAKPYAATHGVELLELSKADTLMQRIARSKTSIPIPVRMSGSGAIGTRQCTQRFKIAVVAAELKRRGVSTARPATLGLGISLDEFSRMRTTAPVPYERLVYPLIDRRMDRQDCLNVIQREGLPVPPKSSCYFCPFHSAAQWRTLRREQPDLFAKSVDLERTLNARRTALGRDPVWLSASLRPLDETFREDGQLSLFDEEASCDVAGYCHV